MMLLYVCNEQSSDFTDDITGVCSLDTAMRLLGPRANESQIFFLATPLPGTPDVSRWAIPSDNSTSSAEARASVSNDAKYCTEFIYSVWTKYGR